METRNSIMPLESQTAASPDESALQRARRGHADAFGELLREHESRVYSIARRFTGRRSDAEELTQDVFVLLHGSLKDIHDDDHLRRWLLRAVTHRCLNRLRDESRRPKLVPIESMPEDAEPPVIEPATDPLMSARLQQLLLELSTEARAVLLLRFQEDLDPTEIAAVLDMPVNTVKSHLRRSLDWLREKCAGENHGY